MKSGAGKAKGGAFERECSRRFSLWVSNGSRDDLFWRSATSGGRATFLLRTRGQLTPAQAGDMTAIDPAGYALAEQCLFEFKFLKNLNTTEGLIKGTGNLIKFWQRTCQDADTYGKQPVLVARQNLFPTLLIVRSGCILFDGTPILRSDSWGADFYLFDRVTEVQRPRMVRRTQPRKEVA